MKSGELTGMFEGAVGTIAMLALTHFAFGVGLHFIPGGEGAMNGATSWGADLVKKGLSAVGLDAGVGSVASGGVTPIENMGSIFG